jgi:hypothetical protein
MILGWSPSLCLYSSNLATFWLKIEQFWPFEKKKNYSNGGHLGYRTALTDTILKGNHSRIISAISIIMNFLTYITGFFMDFELLPILNDYAN